MITKIFKALTAIGPCLSLACPLEQRQQAFQPAPGNFPQTGDDTIAGGIFCIPLSDLGAYLASIGNNPAYTGPESPSAPGQATSGSGPYPAHMTTDPTFPDHTIYAPISPPNITMPFIAWGNGGCGTDGAAFQNFLVEIASHGYVISADGPPGGRGGQSSVADMRASLDWAERGGASAYGDVDTERMATAGQSCGGLEAMSTAYNDPRVKRIILFNIAIFLDERRYLLDKIDVPIAWFVGGPEDMGYMNAEKDYDLLSDGLPALKANLDTGHGGTFSATNGGKFGKAAVAYLEWQFRDDTVGRDTCLDPEAEGSLVTDNWSVEFKNWS